MRLRAEARTRWRAWLALALLIGALLLAIGVAEIMLAIRLRPHEGWGWIVATGVVSAVAGVMLALTWPQNSFWVLGFYVGVSMISGGVWRIVLALALRKRHLKGAGPVLPAPEQA
jgi:uncharacterized membrane protein HdeD (DUF308 family)